MAGPRPAKSLKPTVLGKCAAFVVRISRQSMRTPLADHSSCVLRVFLVENHRDTLDCMQIHLEARDTR